MSDIMFGSEKLLLLCEDRTNNTNELHKPNDYYGHATILKKYCGLPKHYQIKAAIEHGPTIQDYVWEPDINVSLPAVIFCGNNRHLILKKRTQKALFSIGPYLHYAGPALRQEELEGLKTKLGKTLVAFPFHSTHWIHSEYNLEHYCATLKALGKDFDTLCVCLYWKDVERGWATVFEGNGVLCTSAGHMYDALFLPRLKNILTLADVTTSNFIGTHVGYSILMGKPHWFTETPDLSVNYQTDNNKIHYPSDKLHLLPEFKRLIEAFSTRETDITEHQRDIVDHYWGISQLKTPQQLCDLLAMTEDMYQRGPNFFMKQKNTLGNMAAEYLKNKQASQALVCFEHALLSEPHNPDLLLGKAKALLLMDRQEEAKKTHLLECSKSETPAERFPHATFMLNRPRFFEFAKQEFENGNTEVAFHFFNKTKTFKTPIPGLDFWRALCFKKMNKLAAAREALREELRYFPDHSEAFDLLNEITDQESHRGSAPTSDTKFASLLETIRPYTMVGAKRLHSLYILAKNICCEDIPGDFAECGVAAGGSTALLAYVIKEYSKRPRLLYACDSYEGMPDPTDEDVHNGISANSTGWGAGTCAAPEASVREICRKLGVLDIVEVVKGYFQETLPNMRTKIGDIGFLHMDGDWYESTKSILENLYSKISDGGIIQVDDYGHWEGCKKALHEFEQAQKLHFDLHTIDYSGVWFKKPPCITTASAEKLEASRATRVLALISRQKRCTTPKIVHLCASDGGGAGMAAYRLHKGLQDIGIDSTMVVANKHSRDPSVVVLPDEPQHGSASCRAYEEYKSRTWAAQQRNRAQILKAYPNYPNLYEPFTDAVSVFQVEHIAEVQAADIINLHWVAGLVHWPSVHSIFAGKSVVWTIHDMNPFTGGCHFSSGCRRYEEACGLCPKLGSVIEADFSRKVWQQKAAAYRQLDIRIVAPSKWLSDCAQNSSLLGSFSHTVIPYGIPTDVFSPRPKEYARKMLGIPDTAKVVLFGAADLKVMRKGFTYLVAALQCLQNSASKLFITTFGKINDSAIKSLPFPGKHFGPVEDADRLSLIYSAADIFCIPSLEDNLPNTGIEAMACGVPVVGFNAGGIPDMVAHKRTGYLVEPRDIAGLIEGMNWLLSPDAEKHNLEENCKKKARKEYALDVQAHRYRELFERIHQMDGQSKYEILRNDASQNVTEPHVGSARNINEEGKRKTRIAHIVNPVIVSETSDLHFAQPVTFETMRQAKAFADGRLEVSLYSAHFPEHAEIVPDWFITTRTLDRSVLNFGTFKKQRNLPLIRDILDRLYESSDAEYFIYSNVDIALMPYFYTTVKKIIEQGYDAFVINRRTISNYPLDVDSVPLMYAELGKKHPGHDCFVFRRDVYPEFKLGNVCVGVNWVGRALICNLVGLSSKFREITDAHLTFHLGNDKIWKSDGYEDYRRFNGEECYNALKALEKELGCLDRYEIVSSSLRELEGYG
jgi:glycosyltransferase involved in cell wall biosynthesis